MFICRACLSEGQVGFQTIAEPSLLSNYYTDLTRIDLEPDQHLSRMLCKKCSAMLILFNYFKLSCVSSNANLKQKSTTNRYQIKEEDSDVIMADNIVDEIDLTMKSEGEYTAIKMMSDENFSDASTWTKTNEKTSGAETVKYMKLMRELGYVKCGQCEKTFTKLGTFYKHKRDHNTTSMCDLCGHQFSSSRALRTHHIFKHQDERKFKCGLCDFAFKVKSSLEGHMQSRHTKERNYVCDRCSATFKSKRSVQGHIRMIHSNKPLNFECDQCDKKFKTRAYLSVHKNSHTGQKMFFCPLCRTEFTTKKYRDIHMEKKRCQNKPFQCHVCSQIFKEKRNHRLHMRRFHPDIPESEAKAVQTVKDVSVTQCA